MDKMFSCLGLMTIINGNHMPCHTAVNDVSKINFKNIQLFPKQKRIPPLDTQNSASHQARVNIKSVQTALASNQNMRNKAVNDYS